MRKRQGKERNIISVLGSLQIDNLKEKLAAFAGCQFKLARFS
jgi:hypothetical protein